MNEVGWLEFGLFFLGLILGVTVYWTVITARELKQMTRLYSELVVKYSNLHAKAIAWIPRSHMEELWKSSPRS